MKKVKLKEILEVKRGTSLSGKYYSDTGDKIRLTLGNFDYPGGGFKENTAKADIYFTGEVKPQFILKKGDIITPLTEQVSGLLGETAIIPEDNKYIQSGDIGLVIPNPKELDSRFAYYLISSSIIKKQLDVSSQQTKIRHTSPEKIMDCIAWIPELKIQRKIAKFLDFINEKIKNNSKINNNLEELMKTIYQRWFIEFEFPNKEGKPYKSNGGKLVYNDILKKQIPEKWSVKKIGELTEVITGKEDANFSTQNGKYKFFTCSNEILQCDVSAFEGSSILIAGNGDFNVKHYTGRFNAYQRTYVLIPKDISLYCSMYISALYKINSFKRGSNGSIVKFITKNDVENIDVIIPNQKEYLKELNEIIFKIEKNNMENDKLKELKEFILPLLMNSQINVDDIESWSDKL